MIHTRRRFSIMGSFWCFKHRAHLATTKEVAVASGETQEDNQNFNWKADIKNSDRITS